jgi:hypothetical protein
VRFVISDKTVAENKVEVKKRNSADAVLLNFEEALKII